MKKIEDVKAKIEDIKELRRKTQAGYADCKEALLNSTNIFEAEKYLIQKGLKIMNGAVADTNEHGVIKAYVHPGDRICATVEVGCETDFVAKTEEFQSFVREMAMQVASMKPLFIARSDVSFEREAQEMSFRRERLEQEGYEEEALNIALVAEMEQWFTEVCLLEQPYMRDNKKSVKDVMAELSTKIQENCKIRRFARWEVGEKCEEFETEMVEGCEVNLLTKMRLPALIVFISLLTVFIGFCAGG